MDPDAVAKAGFDGLMRGQRVVIPGLTNRLLGFSTRAAPRWLPPISRSGSTATGPGG